LLLWDWFLELERTTIFVPESHGFAVIGQLRLFEDFRWTREALAREALMPTGVHLGVAALVLGSIERTIGKVSMYIRIF